MERSKVKVFEFMPEEIRVEDLLLLISRNNKMIIKEPKKNRYKHITFQIDERSFNIHETIEKPEGNNTHLSIAEFSFDWQLAIFYMYREFAKQWKRIITFIRLDSPKWNQIEADIFPESVRKIFIPSIPKKLLIDSKNIGEYEPIPIEMGKLPRKEISIGMINRDKKQFFLIAHNAKAVLINITDIEKIVNRATIISMDHIIIHRFSPRLLLFKLEVILTKIWHNLTGISIQEIKDETTLHQVALEFAQKITDHFSSFIESNEDCHPH